MSLRRLSRFLPAVVLALFIALVGASRSPSYDGPTREQQIEELKKQIAELQKKLADLDKAGDNTPEGAIPDEWVKSLHWRSFGPATMGGRITAISVFEADPNTYLV